MSILIKGADISPDRIQCITVFPEGFAIVEEYDMLVPIKTTKCEVAPVPTPHGRLIDADELMELYQPAPEDVNEWEHYTTTISVIRQNIKDAPTVIEAEG